MTTIITIKIGTDTTHAGKTHSEISIFGDGSIDHMLDAFRCALVSAGFACETAARLQVVDGNE